MRRSLVFLMAGLLLPALFFWIYFPTFSKYRELKIQEEWMTEEIKALDEKNQELAEEEDLLRNDSMYVEKIIREEMGLVRPGEVVYKFVSEDPRAVQIPGKVLASSTNTDLPAQSMESAPAVGTSAPVYPRKETR